MNVSAQTRSGSLSANGGRFVGFTIDGDTRAGFSKIYPASTPYFNDDDWFKAPGYTGAGKSIIDVSDSALLRTRLQAGENISFTKRMAYQPYDIRLYYPTGNPADGVAPQFLVDGVYFRDYFANDSTAFTSANKNGQNPNNWMGGYANTGAKSDIIDVYTHVRTSGTNPVTDSVWFFAGVSTKNVVGERYFDIEVYREPIYHTPAASGAGVNFVSTGTAYGHSRWELNSAGNVTRTGDIIISVAYKSGLAPDIDFRIWLAKSTYDSIQSGRLVPTRFKLNGRWDVADDGLHGYAEITANAAGEIWGSGLGNFTGSASADSTYATPWGTINTGGTWSQSYDQLQFVEIGLNFSRFGMNPFQYVTSFCKSPYASIMVKSRSSTSFSANLDDFVGPVNFSVKEAVPFSVTPEVLTCARTASRLAWNFSARNYYRLIAPNGDTLAKNFDFRDSAAVNRYLTVTKPGNYRVEATNFQGCPTLSAQTIAVNIDTIAPTAQVLLGFDRPYYFLRGGDTAASNSVTPFGRSGGLTFNWTGPDNFSSTQQNPIIDTVKKGNYVLTIHEARNGCIDKDSIYLASSSFTLAVNSMQLTLLNRGGGVLLQWQSPGNGQRYQYIVERSTDGGAFQSIVRMAYTGEANLSYLDENGSKGYNRYRVKATAFRGVVLQSNIVTTTVAQPRAGTWLRPNRGEVIFWQAKNIGAGPVQVYLSNISGQVVGTAHFIAAENGTYHFPLPALLAKQTVLVTAYRNGVLISAVKL